MKISIVIPAYNEAENIVNIVQQIISNVTLAPHVIKEYEIIIVDDCSNDGTFEQVSELNSPNVSGIRLSRRSGSHIAIRAGLDSVSGDAVICLAADGQDDPNIIIKMIKEWEKGKHIVWALRKKRNDESFLSTFLAKSFYRLLSILGGSSSSIDLSRADFYLLDHKIINAIRSCPETNTSLFGLIAWLGFNQGFIEYERPTRYAGCSKWTLRAKVRLAKDWIIAFSGIPLKIMTLSGFVIATSGFIYAIFVIIHGLLFGSPILGWSSVMTMILLLGGGQMIMLGIIGEYLWRTLDESRNRPTYFIEHDTSNNPNYNQDA